MKKRITTLILAILLFLPLSTAISTEIKVKTVPYYEVQLTTFNYDSSNFEAIERFVQESDRYGDVTFNHESQHDKFGIIVFIKWNGETVMSEKYDEPFTAGEPIYLEFEPKGIELTPTPEAAEPAKNDTDNSTIQESPEITEGAAEETVETTETQETSGTEAGITGRASSDVNSPGSSIMFYILAAMALVAVFAFSFAAFSRYKKSRPPQFKFTPPKNKELPPMPTPDNSSEIEQLENKIKEAQAQLNKIKNAEKIKEAEARLQRDQEELEKLRKGEI